MRREAGARRELMIGGLRRRSERRLYLKQIAASQSSLNPGPRRRTWELPAAVAAAAAAAVAAAAVAVAAVGTAAAVAVAVGTAAAAASVECLGFTALARSWSFFFRKKEGRPAERRKTKQPDALSDQKSNRHFTCHSSRSFNESWLHTPHKPFLPWRYVFRM